MASDIKKVLERATARPWSVYKESQFIISNDGEDLATAENMYIGGVDTARANAELIVTAVNSFESNRELIRELAEALTDCYESLSRLPDTEGAWRVTCMSEARDALAKVRESRVL